MRKRRMAGLVQPAHRAAPVEGARDKSHVSHAELQAVAMGETSPNSRVTRRVRRHTAACAGCLNTLECYRLLGEGLALLSEPSPTILERVLRRVRALDAEVEQPGDHNADVSVRGEKSAKFAEEIVALADEVRAALTSEDARVGRLLLRRLQARWAARGRAAAFHAVLDMQREKLEELEERKVRKCPAYGAWVSTA
jgi:hypothetical protein